MPNGIVIPLIIHGHILWSPAARTNGREQPCDFPLIGEVRYQHMLLMPAADQCATTRCPMTAITDDRRGCPRCGDADS